MTSDIIATDANSIIKTLEPAIDPGNRPTFLIDWEVTLKCNLDCSYCDVGPYGGHWNSSKHPPLDECMQSIDFMFEYTDLYMQHKKKWGQAAVLNVYGGESFYHPDIVEILSAVREKYLQGKYTWPLTVTTTTNLVAKKSLVKKIAPLIDEFTVSYHCESTAKQKSQVLENIEYLQSTGKRLKVIVLMHSNFDYWPELINLIEHCDKNNIRYIVKQLDGEMNSNYNQEQLQWFQNLYNNRGYNSGKDLQQELIAKSFNDNDLSPLSGRGRSCCGGRHMCVDENYKQPVNWVPNNNFQNWHCSVNWFFVYIKQWNQEIFVNKDCKMDFTGQVAPIGNVKNYKELISQTRQMLENNQMPVIQCKKEQCVCGLCAPKAQNKDMFIKIMKKHADDVFRTNLD